MADRPHLAAELDAPVAATPARATLAAADHPARRRATRTARRAPPAPTEIAAPDPGPAAAAIAPRPPLPGPEIAARDPRGRLDGTPGKHDKCAHGRANRG